MTSSMQSYEEIVAGYDPLTNNTRNIMTKYEKTAMIGMRTQQLSNNAPTTLTEDELNETISIRDIAMKEFQLKKIPLMVERNVNGNKEYWKIEDMIIDFA